MKDAATAKALLASIAGEPWGEADFGERLATDLGFHFTSNERVLGVFRPPERHGWQLRLIVVTEKSFVLVRLTRKDELKIESFSTTKLRGISTTTTAGSDWFELELKFAAGVFDWGSGYHKSELILGFKSNDDPELVAFLRAVNEARR